MAIKRCTQSFAASIDGVPVIFTAESLFDEGDATYKGLNAEQRRLFFEDAEVYTQRRMTSQVEQATAAPGEARTVSTTKRTRKSGD